MSRLPNTGADLEAWGPILNDYLLVGHAADGTHAAITPADNSITTAKIVDLNVTTIKIADSAVTAAKIANRTRYAFIPAGAFQPSVGAPSFSIGGTDSAGHWLLDAALLEAVASTFVVPADWTSGNLAFYIYLAPVIAGAAGLREVAIELQTVVISPGGALNSGGQTLDLISTDATTNILSVTLHSRAVGVSAGQLVGVGVRRIGTDGGDDLAVDVKFMGVRIDYTADS